MFGRPACRSARCIATATARQNVQRCHRRGFADATTQQTTEAPRKGGFGKLVGLTLFGGVFAAVGAGAMWKTMTANNMGFLSDADSLRAFTPDEADAEALKAESTINNHPLVKSLRDDPIFTESRPHLKMPANYRARSLTAGALSGPRKVPVPAYQWLAPEGKAITAITYVGEDLCGHPGIVHGGFLATMLDEGLARCCFDALPHKIGVTANLNIDYRKPTPAGSFLVLKAETTKVEGRKAWVKGHIELLAAPGEKPTILAEATALYVSPKFAKMMPRIQ